MSTLERQIPDEDGSRRKVIIIVALVAAIIIAIFFYFLMRASSSVRVEPTLAGAVRAGSPEFEQYKSKISIDEPVDATEAKRALGDIVMNLQATVRNFTGRTLKGLEVKGMVVDHQGQPVNQRTVVVVPTIQPELENNRTIAVNILLEGMTDQDDRANIKVEVTGFIFK
jgi:hypothetical protein